jgi:hypothetical protein
VPGQLCSFWQLSKPAPDQARASAESGQLGNTAVAGNAARRNTGQYLKKGGLALVVGWRVERWRYSPVFHG